MLAKAFHNPTQTSSICNDPRTATSPVPKKSMPTSSLPAKSPRSKGGNGISSPNKDNDDHHHHHMSTSIFPYVYPPAFGYLNDDEGLCMPSFSNLPSMRPVNTTGHPKNIPTKKASPLVFKGFMA